MKIAELAPLIESVPPRFYGGTERIVSYLTEELVGMGHEVTLFASGDSQTSAKLIPMCSKALRLDEKVCDYQPYDILMQEKFYHCFRDFDLIHSHVDYNWFPLLRHINIPSVTTLHGRLDLPDLIPVYKEFTDTQLISISNNQRTPFPGNNWLATIYHGLPENLYTYKENPEEYLAFLGRTSREKGLEQAIEIAKRVGIKLKISSKVDKIDKIYFETNIKPLFNSDLIEFIGETDDKGKNDLLANALGLLFPINWPEPFGLVMIEALACGTPIVAYRRGSVPEVLEDGVSGFICNDVKEAVAAVKRLPSLSRKRCRQIFEERFAVRRMAEDYLKVFNKL